MLMLVILVTLIGEKVNENFDNDFGTVDFLVKCDLRERYWSIVEETLELLEMKAYTAWRRLKIKY